MVEFAPVEIVSSLAHHRDGAIRVVLHLPTLAHPSTDTVPVRLASGERSFRVPATATPAEPGISLEFSVRTQRLGRGVWTLAMRPAVGERLVPIEARLLTGRGQPIALIPGPVPATRLAAPVPAASAPPAAPAAGPVTRVAARARRLLGRGVRRLRGGVWR
ncbi:hypothetical protein NOCA2170002 [metagenome]|uniref:Uncharacterized protein n=1 Tax=metagenome TaxID=256318 RepID=A0A2P2BXG2_9ZZZZ